MAFWAFVLIDWNDSKPLYCKISAVLKGMGQPCWKSEKNREQRTATINNNPVEKKHQKDWEPATVNIILQEMTVPWKYWE